FQIRQAGLEFGNPQFFILGSVFPPVSLVMPPVPRGSEVSAVGLQLAYGCVQINCGGLPAISLLMPPVAGFNKTHILRLQSGCGQSEWMILQQCEATPTRLSHRNTGYLGSYCLDEGRVIS